MMEDGLFQINEDIFFAEECKKIVLDLLNVEILRISFDVDMMMLEEELNNLLSKCDNSN